MKQALVDEAILAARASEHATGLPAVLTLAQWALESGWGEHAPGNNVFGIKAYAGCNGTQLLWTEEEINGKLVRVQASFATFATLADCFIKHARLLTQGFRYLPAWIAFTKTHDLDAFIRKIGPIYSTESTYADSVITLMHSPTLRKMIAPQPQPAVAA